MTRFPEIKFHVNTEVTKISSLMPGADISVSKPPSPGDQSTAPNSAQDSNASPTSASVISGRASGGAESATSATIYTGDSASEPEVLASGDDASEGRVSAMSLDNFLVSRANQAESGNYIFVPKNRYLVHFLDKSDDVEGSAAFEHIVFATEAPVA